MMPHGIVKLADDEYVEWSTVVDSPISSAWWREAMLMLGFDSSDLDEADRRGHTFAAIDGATAEEFVSYNRAGPDEKCISLDAIRKRFKPGKRDHARMMNAAPPGSTPNQQ